MSDCVHCRSQNSRRSTGREPQLTEAWRCAGSAQSTHRIDLLSQSESPNCKVIYQTPSLSSHGAGNVKRKQSYVWMLWTYFPSVVALFPTRCKWTLFPSGRFFPSGRYFRGLFFQLWTFFMWTYFPWTFFSNTVWFTHIWPLVLRWIYMH